MFQKAEKKGLYARIAVIGPSGSGKTMWSLKIAAALSNKRVGVIDTEHRSASKYADKFDFDVAEFIDSYSPQLYLKAISDARDHYDVLVIDSLTHAWSGQDGLLEQVDNIARRSKSRSSFHAWREVTPIHNKLVESMLSFPGHLIVTMRSKTEYVQEKDDKGKTQIRKV
ncbi:MAG: ATP-binding protein, partial [Bacteroidota bacterium]|nr:ATP-binding protein [Bacteroidota bacterium]